MTRPLAIALGLALLLPAGACAFLPGDPEAVFRAHPPPPPPSPLPEPETTWLDLGRELLAGDRPEEAGEAFVRSLHVEGVTAAALTGAGLAAERQGMLAEARRHFEAARLHAPRSATAHLNLGVVLYRMGELHAARRAFQAALELSGGTSEFARRNIAVSDAAIRRAETAAMGPDAPNAPHVERIGPARFRLIGASELRGDG
jgi:tetratricopeptide (TPR) repeat protein